MEHLRSFLKYVLATSMLSSKSSGYLAISLGLADAYLGGNTFAQIHSLMASLLPRKACLLLHGPARHVTLMYGYRTSYAHVWLYNLIHFGGDAYRIPNVRYVFDTQKIIRNNLSGVFDCDRSLRDMFDSRHASGRCHGDSNAR